MSYEFLVRGRPARRREFVHGHPAWLRLARADGRVDELDAILRADVEDPHDGVHRDAFTKRLEALVLDDAEPHDPLTAHLRRAAAADLVVAIRAHDLAVAEEIGRLRPRSR